MTALASDLLRGSRELVEDGLRAAVARLDPRSREISSYHFGWTDLQGRPISGNPGKAVRPTLALLSARAAGQPAEVALPAAIAVELVHNFSLLHDDVMDGDLERRHRPTVWAQWGSSSAILTGDAMLTLAQQVLLEAPGPHTVLATRLLAEATQQLVAGQVDDLAFETRLHVGLEECVQMAAGKTGALLAVSSAIGAQLAGAPSALVDALWAFGAELGLAFQLVDDLLGIWGDPATTGKPVMSDLRSRKKSLPVTYAVQSGTPAGQQLREWLAADGEHTEAELQQGAQFVESAGARAWAVAEADRRLLAAEAALRNTDMPTDVREEFSAIGRFVIARQS